VTTTAEPPVDAAVSEPTPEPARPGLAHRLGRRVVKHLIRLVVVVWGSLTVIFFLQHLSGDPVALLLPDGATRQQIAAVRSQLGLDRPLIVQYGIFLGHFVTGQFGYSYVQDRPVSTIVLERMPATLELAGAAVLITTVFGTLFGVLAARMRRRWVDKIVVVLSLLGQSVPTFWLGIIAIQIFAVRLHLLPSSGRGGLEHLVLPAVTLAAFSLANTTRIARASMIESLSSEYVQTARAKGLSGSRVVGIHALKNSSISILTLTAYTFSTLMGGALVTEVVFAWPGIGSEMVEGVTSRDYPVVQGAVFMIALFVVVIYFLLDMAYTFLDPRLRSR
jgi:peptide/nickel transport system permease protein